MKKEQLKKIASWLSEAVNLFKEQKQDEAVSKLEDITKEIESIQPEEWTEDTTQELTKTVEEIKKRAYMSIDAQTIKDLLDQFNDLKTSIVKKEDLEDITKRLEKVEETPVVEQETIEKTANKSVFSWIFG